MKFIFLSSYWHLTILLSIFCAFGQEWGVGEGGTYLSKSTQIVDNPATTPIITNMLLDRDSSRLYTAYQASESSEDESQIMKTDLDYNIIWHKTYNISVFNHNMKLDNDGRSIYLYYFNKRWIFMIVDALDGLVKNATGFNGRNSECNYIEFSNDESSVLMVQDSVDSNRDLVFEYSISDLYNSIDQYQVNNVNITSLSNYQSALYPFLIWWLII